MDRGRRRRRSGGDGYTRPPEMGDRCGHRRGHRRRWDRLCRHVFARLGCVPAGIAAGRGAADGQPSPTPTPPAVADAAGPSSSPPPGSQPNEAADRHREAVNALIRAYNEIADGYARIRDAGSIPSGNAPISQGVAQLRSAAQRGQGPASALAARAAGAGPTDRSRPAPGRRTGSSASFAGCRRRPACVPTSTA